MKFRDWNALLRLAGRHVRLLTGLLLAIAGCGQRAPYTIVPVSGTVTYDDGTSIPGARVVVTFVPQIEAVNPKEFPRSGTTDLKPDGSFSEVTTWKHGDGVIPGAQKVTVISVDERMQPTGAVDPIYSRIDTTPLTAVINSGDNRVTLTIAAPTPRRKP
jgi:hypothetical protein